MKIRLLWFELIVVFRRARRHRLISYRDPYEPYINNASKEEKCGDVLVRIFAPFDRKTGQTDFRFSLVNTRQGFDEEGDLLVRRSFYENMEKDMLRAVVYACRYIRRAKAL